MKGHKTTVESTTSSLRLVTLMLLSRKTETTLLLFILLVHLQLYPQHKIEAIFAYSTASALGLQDIVSSAQQSKLEVEYLRRDRDRALHALNFARDSLDPSFPTFDLTTSDFDFSVESFAQGVASRLSNRHHRAEEERDDYLAANKEYAMELRALRAEHVDSESLWCIQSLKAGNQRLRADLASSKHPSSVNDS
jgi:hypothetical protein